MKKNDSLKKHHFWILFGLVPLFVLIAVFAVTSSVGAEIDKKSAEIKATEASVSGKNPKPKKLVELLNKSIDRVANKNTSLWKENWERQKPLFTWPENSPQLQAVQKMDLAFGKTIPEDNFTRAEFKKPEVYLAVYSNEDPTTRKPATKGMATTIAPTEFRGGWQNVLRHVTRNGWGAANPTSEQIWLLMEDIWVQRSLLQAIRSVNEQMGTFERVKLVREGVTIDDPDTKSRTTNPKHRRFQSRTWAVELELKQKDDRQVLGGRLINVTDRLQLMGLNNTMVLNVWLKTPTDTRRFEFRIGGEFVPGRGALKPDGSPANVLDIVETRDHVIPATFGTATEIVRVEQKFDTRTVPIRRIEAMALGKTDSRHAGSELVIPNFEVFLKEAENAGTGTTTDPGGLPGTEGGISMPMPGGVGMPGVPGGPSTLGGEGTTTTQRLWGGGTLEQIVDGNKKRYIDVTAHVRRMPVGITVLVDQSLIQDVLLAFANTPLRFQVTQFTWQRYRRNDLGGAGGGTGSAGEYGMGDGGIIQSGEGNFSPELGSSGAGMYGSGYGGRLPPGGTLPPPGPPGGMGGVAPDGGGQGDFSPQPGGYNPNPYSPYGSSSLGSVSESQITSGLVELSIYGVVSIYEKYDPNKDKDPEATGNDPDGKPLEGEPKKDDMTPKDGEPKDGEPKKDSDPMPKDGMPTDPKTPKMRRRLRRPAHAM